MKYKGVYFFRTENDPYEKYRIGIFFSMIKFEEYWTSWGANTIKEMKNYINLLIKSRPGYVSRLKKVSKAYYNTFSNQSKII